MNTLIHADIFFFIATIGFIILFILLAIAAYYLITFLRSVRRITLQLEHDAEAIGEDAKELMSDLRDSTVFRLLFGVKKRRPVRHTSKKVQ
jgi:uncharacterized SAM-binding protein YcdF (DUF218 family)